MRGVTIACSHEEAKRMVTAQSMEWEAGRRAEEIAFCVNIIFLRGLPRDIWKSHKAGRTGIKLDDESESKS